MGWRWRKANRFEDMREHWDYAIENVGKVEVRSIKCARRGGKPDPSLFYFETKCVGGGKGWLYGHADWIALQQEEMPKANFVMLKRDALVHWCEEKSLAGGFTVASHSGIKGTRWSRPGRGDEVLVADRGEVLRALAPQDILWVGL